MQETNNSQANPSPNHPSSKPAVSERKLAANRANAQHSTGPRTREGKQRAAMNALRHGILAKSAFCPTIEGDDKRAQFEEILEGLIEEYQPREMTEVMTVQQLAGCYWKLAKVWNYEMQQSLRAQTVDDLNAAAKETGYALAEQGQKEILKAERKKLAEVGLGQVYLPFGPTINTILRYQGAINSMMARCLTLLERRRKERIAAGEFEYPNEPTEESGEEASTRADRSDLPERTQNDGPEAAAADDQTAKDASSASIASASPAPPRDDRA